MADFKKASEFKKGARMRTINEDPTYLSFIFLFHYDDHHDVGHSPLLDGTAERYLREVVRTDLGTGYADNLANFKRVLRKVNMEMPWFWQTLKGVETALQYKDMKEPWWGAETPTLEIECLEENVELTAIGLMDLYKRACFDYERWVEIVPKNLREFSMDVIISEVRTFQKDTNARNLGVNDTPGSDFNSSNSEGGPAKDIHQYLRDQDYTSVSAEAKPFIRLRFTHCEFDPDAIADYFADLSKNPEAKKPSLKIKWGAVHQLESNLGTQLFGPPKEDSISSAANIPSAYGALDSNVFGKIANQDAAEDTPASRFNTQKFVKSLKGSLGAVVDDVVGDVVDDITGNVARLQNTANSILGGTNGLDNVHGDRFRGATGNFINNTIDNQLGSLLLGNVYGANQIGNVQDALSAGTINALFNGAGSLITPDSLEPANPGPITPTKVYDPIPTQPQRPIKENVHPEAIDSTPDGNLNENIHPNAVDSTPDGNLNDNVHD